MNAAARALAQGALGNVTHQALTLSRQTLGVIFLIVAVLASALTVVYVKTLDRQLYSDLQVLQETRDNLKTQAGQLLLEQNTWAATGRVQAIAQQRLSMYVPATKQIAVIALAKTTQGTTVDG